MKKKLKLTKKKKNDEDEEAFREQSAAFYLFHILSLC